MNWREIILIKGFYTDDSCSCFAMHIAFSFPINMSITSLDKL
jgi:hypothetical protein